MKVALLVTYEAESPLTAELQRKAEYAIRFMLPILSSVRFEVLPGLIHCFHKSPCGECVEAHVEGLARLQKKGGAL